MDDLLTAQFLEQATIEETSKDSKPKYSLHFERRTGLQRVGDLKPDQLLLFFDKCNDAYERPEVIDALKVIAKRRNDTDAAISALQKKIFAEELSVDPEHGLEFLGKIVTKYKDDPRIMIPFQYFISREELAMDQLDDVPEDQIQGKKMMLENMNKLNGELLEKVKDKSTEDAKAMFKQMEREQQKMVEQKNQEMQVQMVKMLATMEPQRRIEFVQQQVTQMPAGAQRNAAIEQFKMILFLAEQEHQRKLREAKEGGKAQGAK